MFEWNKNLQRMIDWIEENITDSLSLKKISEHFQYIYNDISDSVMEKVDEMAWNWNPEEHGYQWNDIENPIYQRSNPEKFGYAICRPIKVIK